jgi:DNA-directed RNA polymerase specialized sigma24 family protein
VRALGDAALLDAMRADDAWAWGEFIARFQGPLESYAGRIGVPQSEWAECIVEVLDDEALRLTSANAATPAHLFAYLARAVRNRYLRIKRARQRRELRYAEASTGDHAEPVVRSVCSEAAIRDGYGADVAPSSALSGALVRLGDLLSASMTADERTLLAWEADRVPHRQIASWLGVSYDAATKRIWRLCRRLRARVPSHVTQFSDIERAELARFFRRARGVERSGQTPHGHFTGTDDEPK